MVVEDKHYVSSKNNKLTKDDYSYEEAKEILDDIDYNGNVDCVDCISCMNCHNCHECFNCNNCRSCYECDSCKNLEEFTNVQNIDFYDLIESPIFDYGKY